MLHVNIFQTTRIPSWLTEGLTTAYVGPNICFWTSTEFKNGTQDIAEQISLTVDL